MQQNTQPNFYLPPAPSIDMDIEESSIYNSQLSIYTQYSSWSTVDSGKHLKLNLILHSRIIYLHNMHTVSHPAPMPSVYS